MEQKILKEVRFLKIYAFALTLAFIALFTLSFTDAGEENKTFNEITAQRLNIVSPKGELRMVISNAEHQSPGSINGKKFPDRERQQGIIFFNKAGDEVGGLVFDNRGLVLSVDKYKKDQIMQLQYYESKTGDSRYGLQLWDREGKLNLLDRIAAWDSLKKLNYDNDNIETILTQMNGKPLSPHRLFVGKKIDGQVGLFIQDESGNNRIKIYVGKDNKAHLEFLDDNGKSIPLEKL